MSRNYSKKDTDSRDQGSRRKYADKEDRTTKTKYGKGKGKKSNKDEKVDLTLPQNSSHAEYNNIAHYIRDARILEQASQMSFQNFIGGTPVGEYSIPSIMRFFMNPTPGLTYQKAASSIVHPRRAGINMAATKLFNSLSMSSGRNMAYAPQDIGLLILALGALYHMDSYVRRLFGSVNMWNNYNRMFPVAIVEAMGIDYEDFVSNYADYRTRYNALLASVNQLPLLMNCGFLEKSMDQYSYVFTDDDSPLSQCYIYLPRTTWILDETSYQGGTILKTVEVCKRTSTRTFADLMINVLRPMVEALINSSTLNLVYADLLNLATKVSTLKFTTFQYIEDGIAVLPIKNWEALLHIHNMSVLGHEPSIPTFTDPYTPNNDVYPDADKNLVIYNPGYPKASVTPGTNDHLKEHFLVDSPVPAPDAATRIEMTRYKATWTNNDTTISGTKYLTYVIVPDYVCVRADIIQNDVSQPFEIGTLIENSAFHTNGNAPELCPRMSQFNWHPIVEVWSTASEKDTLVFGDLNYFTELTREYLERLNVVIFLGLFELY